MSELKSFFKDTVIYGVAAVLPRFINIGLLAIFTSVLGTVDFSLQTTWYVYAAFINIFLTMGIETAFFRFYSTESDKTKVISTSFLLLLISSFIFCTIGLLFSDSLSEYFKFKDPLFVILLIIITVIDTLVVVPFAYLRVTNRPIRFMILKTANVVVLSIVTVILLLLIPYLISKNSSIIQAFGISSDYKPNVIHIIAANLVASIFTLLTLSNILFKIKWSFDKTLIKKLLGYGIPIMIGGLAYVANENLDKLMIPKIIDENANGIYAACYKLGVFMTLYITAFRMGAEPFFFNHSKHENAKDKYIKIMTWFVILGCIFMVFVVGFIDILAGIFLRKDVYLQGLYIVPIILLANLFSGIYNNLGIWYKLTDRTKMGMYISILGAVFTILFLYLLLPKYGILGGAMATLLTYVSMVLISYIMGQKHYPVHYEWKKISFYILFSTGLCALSFLVFRGNYFVGIAILMVFGLIVIKAENINVSKAMSSLKK